MKWAYGVTTVPARRVTTLPRTLASLAGGGFDQPRLFVDGGDDSVLFLSDFRHLEITFRWPQVGLHGNWVLALYELVCREPDADRYALFQDDLVCVKNLRRYLERCAYPPGSYLNLYTTPGNGKLAPIKAETGEGTFAGRAAGFYPSDQMGRGALGLLFNREAVSTLLSSRRMAVRPFEYGICWKRVDGTVSEAMRAAEFKEYVHNPSLLQHTGKETTLAVSPAGVNVGHPKHAPSETFPGEDFDATELLD